MIDSATKGFNFTKRNKLRFKTTIHNKDNKRVLICAKLEPGRHNLCLKFYTLKLHRKQTRKDILQSYMKLHVTFYVSVHMYNLYHGSKLNFSNNKIDNKEKARYQPYEGGGGGDKVEHNHTQNKQIIA